MQSVRCIHRPRPHLIEPGDIRQFEFQRNLTTEFIRALFGLGAHVQHFHFHAGKGLWLPVLGNFLKSLVWHIIHSN